MGSVMGRGFGDFAAPRDPVDGHGAFARHASRHSAACATHRARPQACGKPKTPEVIDPAEGGARRIEMPQSPWDMPGSSRDSLPPAITSDDVNSVTSPARVSKQKSDSASHSLVGSAVRSAAGAAPAHADAGAPAQQMGSPLSSASAGSPHSMSEEGGAHTRAEGSGRQVVGV